MARKLDENFAPSQKWIGTNDERLAFDTQKLTPFSEWTVVDGLGNITDWWVWDGSLWNH